MIDLKNISFKYKGEQSYAIRGLTAQFDNSGITAIIGESGVGKSTLIALLAGIYAKGDPMVERFDGQIQIDAEEPGKIRGARMISWVPQATSLLDHLTVHENVLLPARLGEVDHGFQQRFSDLIERLDMKSWMSKRPRELSGGMKTRVSLARALVSRPAYLFLDEPFASLDLGNRWNIYEVIAAQRRGDGLTTVMTTHNVPEAMLLANRVVVMVQREVTRIDQVIENAPIDLAGMSREGCLAVARERAPQVEGRIYSAQDAQLG